MANSHKPRLAVVGVGMYYAYLQRGIKENFDPVVLLDRGDYEPTAGGLKRAVERHSPDAVMLLTPNRLHADHIVELAELGLPTLVEKPLVTTEGDLQRVIESVEVNPALFCSDFYIDVWCAPLTRLLGMKSFECMRKWINVRESGMDTWARGRDLIGNVRAVEAPLLEASGDAGSFTGREWLWDPTHGGVLWDMAYHNLATWFTLFNEPLSVVSVARTTIRKASDPEGAETMGTVELISDSGIPFRFQAGKYAPRDERYFKIIGDKGEVSMVLEDPGLLSVNGQMNPPLAWLGGHRGDQVSEVFREFVDSKPTAPHGLDVGIQAVRLMLEIRAAAELRAADYQPEQPR